MKAHVGAREGCVVPRGSCSIGIAMQHHQSGAVRLAPQQGQGQRQTILADEHVFVRVAGGKCPWRHACGVSVADTGNEDVAVGVGGFRRQGKGEARGEAEVRGVGIHHHHRAGEGEHSRFEGGRVRVAEIEAGPIDAHQRSFCYHSISTDGINPRIASLKKGCSSNRVKFQRKRHILAEECIREIGEGEAERAILILEL